MGTPTITWATFRGYLNEYVGDVPFTATTTTAGATDKTTAVSTTCIERYDDFLQNGLDKNSYLYIPSALEERKIYEILPLSGTVVVKYPFTVQVATSKPIEIHRYPPLQLKLKAANRALAEVYTQKHFWNPVYNTTLYGQEGYGEGTAEYNRRLYAVPTTFEEFPTIKIVGAYYGTHTGSDNAAALTDSTKSWKTSELVGRTVYNTTDASSGTITANTSTTITATLAGGTGNDWDEGDEYLVQDPSSIPQTFTNYVRTKVASSGAYEFYAVIPEGKLLILEGRGPLTAFATEAGTTELDDEDARIVCYYAAYCLFDILAVQVTGQDRADYQELANMRLNQYLAFVKPVRLSNTCMAKVDNSWLK